MKMKYSKILLCMTVLVCLAFQACAQSDPLGESARGTDQGRDEMVGWLNQPDPLPADVTKSTTTATSTTPTPDVTKSTTTATSSTPSTDATKSTTTSTTPATEPTSTSQSTTTTTSTPGFEATFGLIGFLAVAFIALRRRR
jgi:PGF-CTERM protein